jgi:hypothetical protein
MATGGSVRRDGSRFAPTVSPFGRQSLRLDCYHTRLTHPALYSAEQLTRWLRRSEAQEGLEGPRRGGHFRTPLLALRVSPASEQEREYVGEMARAVQDAPGEWVGLAYVEQGYTGERAAEEAEAFGMRLEVVKHEAVLDQVRNLQAHALDILERAEKASDLRTALASDLPGTGKPGASWQARR